MLEAITPFHELHRATCSETNAPLRSADGTCRVDRLGPVPRKDIDMCDRHH